MSIPSSGGDDDSSNNKSSTFFLQAVGSQLTIIQFLTTLICATIAFLSYRHMAKYHPTLQQSSPREPVAITSTSLATGTFQPLLLQLHVDDKSGCEDDDDTTTTASSNSNSNSKNDHHSTSGVQRVHVIILVHGWLGCPQDLGYIHTALEVQAAEIVKQRQQRQRRQYQEEEPFYVYTCVSNSGRTNDGIQAGADRIAVEIEQYLQGIKEQNDGTLLQEISLSIVGYSLGGLYSRYALPKILNNPKQQSGKSQPKIIPKVFCTIATPHLGTGNRHNWFRFPKFMDPWLGLITKTGRDLFQLTPHIQNTVTDPYWIKPLLRFEKRIAYANTYSMDLMVPTSTAAFLSKESTSQHFYQTSPSSLRSYDNNSENDATNNNYDNPFVALVVETLPNHNILLQPPQSQVQKGDKDDNASSLDMAQRLDAMGWTKVFVDFSNEYRQPYKESYTSSALHSEFNRSKKRLPIFLPVGHDLVVVNSKNVISSYATQRGRPLVDQLAKDLVQDIVMIGSNNNDNKNRDDDDATTTTCTAA